MIKLETMNAFFMGYSIEVGSYGGPAFDLRSRERDEMAAHCIANANASTCRVVNGRQRLKVFWCAVGVRQGPRARRSWYDRFPGMRRNRNDRAPGWRSLV